MENSFLGERECIFFLIWGGVEVLKVYEFWDNDSINSGDFIKILVIFKLYWEIFIC